MSLPIIRLEVEGMKHTMLRALAEHAEQMDKDIKEAVEAYCTPINIRNVVWKASQAALEFAIKEEVDKFFRYGEGRKAVAAAVKESILKNETYTVMDEVD